MTPRSPHAPPTAPTPRRVAAFATAVLAAAALGLSGCTRDAPERTTIDDADATPALAPLPDAFDGRWRGMLPCADCDGIEVDLRLVRDAAGARFTLVERYLDDAGAGEFAIEGAWGEAPCPGAAEPRQCVLLHETGQRWLRDKDGSLQALDADGQPIDADGARLSRG